MRALVSQPTHPHHPHYHPPHDTSRQGSQVKRRTPNRNYEEKTPPQDTPTTTRAFSECERVHEKNIKSTSRTLTNTKNTVLHQRPILERRVRKQHFCAGFAWGAITRGVPCADAEDSRGGRGETGIGARGVA